MSQIRFWRPGSSAPQQQILQERQEPSSVVYNSYADLSLENQRKRLPIFNYRNHILYLLENHRTLIIVGETGSGKSTQIPQYIIESGWVDSQMKQRIAITEPRRVAAVSLASRVAEERLSVLGEDVGYAIRFDECLNHETTVIKFITDGVLLREIMTDPLLNQYSVILVDEAHERSLNTDLCLGLLKKIQKQRPNLRLIISSATIDADKFHDFFNSKENGSNTCAILSVEGRNHPVDVYYTVDPVPDYVTATVETIMKIHVSSNHGDVLAFLTGRDEVDKAVTMTVERARAAAANGMKKYLKVMPMYSTLPIHEQIKIFEKTSKIARKVVIATNIAETSITIEGVVYIIDCGFVKLKGYNPQTGIESLLVCPISKSSAEQRAGRAGRCRLGRAYRLYREEDFEHLDDITVPEMKRSSLAPVVLQLKNLGVENIARFDFMSPPPAQSIINALEVLFALDALDSNGHLTENVGHQIAEFPLNPLFAKMIINSSLFDCSEEIVSIAAMLQVNNIFSVPTNNKVQAAKEHRKFSVKEGDHLTLLNVFNAFVKEGNESRNWCNRYYLNFKALKRAVQIRLQLVKYLNRFKINLISCEHDTEKVLRCIASGFFPNAARLHPDGTYRSLKGNHSLSVHPSSVLATELPPPYVVFNEVLQTSSYFMRDVSVIKSDWLCELVPHYYETTTDGHADSKRMKLF